MKGHWSGRSLLKLCLAMAFLQLLSLSSTFGIALGGIPDEGTVALQAMRVVSGQLGHRDYFIQTPISGDYWVGAWFWLFGSSLESLRAYFLLEMCLLCATIQYFSARLLPKYWSEAPALFFLCQAPLSWYIASPRWDAIFFAVLALIFTDQKRFGLAGVLVGLSALTHHPIGAMLFFGINCALLLSGQNWPTIRSLLGGVMSLWVPYLFILQYNGALDTFLQDVLFFNLTQYAAPAHFDWSTFSANFTAARGSLGHEPALTSLILLGYAWFDLWSYGAWIPLAVLSLLNAPRKRHQRIAALALAFVFCSLIEFLRPNRYHFNFLAPLFNLLFVYWLRQKPKPGAPILAVTVVAYLLVLVGHTLSNQRSNLPVAFPNGVLYVDSPAKREAFIQIIQTNATIPAGEKVFFFPDEPYLQWLLGRGPATREVGVPPCFFTHSQIQGVLHSLATEPVNYLAHAALEFNAEAHPEISRRYYELEEQNNLRQLTKDYQVWAVSAGVTFYKRK